MTLDEAIKHCEEKAQEQDMLAKRYDDASGYTRSHNESIRTEEAKKRCKCAAEHRQLAAWLKLLKEILDSGDCNDCIYNGICPIEPNPGQMVRYNCYCYSRKEVNADE